MKTSSTFPSINKQSKRHTYHSYDNKKKSYFFLENPMDELVIVAKFFSSANEEKEKEEGKHQTNNFKKCSTITLITKYYKCRNSFI